MLELESVQNRVHTLVVSLLENWLALFKKQSRQVRNEGVRRRGLAKETAAKGDVHGTQHVPVRVRELRRQRDASDKVDERQKGGASLRLDARPVVQTGKDGEVVRDRVEEQRRDRAEDARSRHAGGFEGLQRDALQDETGHHNRRARERNLAQAFGLRGGEQVADFFHSQTEKRTTGQVVRHRVADEGVRQAKAGPCPQGEGGEEVDERRISRRNVVANSVKARRGHGCLNVDANLGHDERRSQRPEDGNRRRRRVHRRHHRPDALTTEMGRGERGERRERNRREKRGTFRDVLRPGNRLHIRDGRLNRINNIRIHIESRAHAHRTLASVRASRIRFLSSNRHNSQRRRAGNSHGARHVNIRLESLLLGQVWGIQCV